jgi:O-antigen/teichoic acid export membrane protein
MVLQSINKFKILWINFSIIALFSVILEIILVKPFGLYGIVAALIIPLLLSAVWQLPLYLKSLKHRYSNQ